MNLRQYLYAICIIIGVTIAYGALYAAVQQSYRQSANDPQIQIAEDAAASLLKGASPASIVSAMPSVDMSQSLAPFIVVLDQNIKPIASSANFAGRSFASSSLPTPPLGVFVSAGSIGENRVTWQTSSGLRFASVVVPWKGGYILAARSLREVESRELQLEVIVGFAWILTLLVMLVPVLFTRFYVPKTSQ